MSTPTLLKLSLVLALGLAALTVAPAPARATVTNITHTWCKARTSADQTIVTSPAAMLVWRADGDLVLEPVAARLKIWSSGTVGPAAATLCWDNDGVLRMRDAAGAPLWSYGTGTTSTGYPGELPWGEYQMAHRLTLTGGCTLTSTRTIYQHMNTGYSGSWKTVWGATTWSRPQTCPLIAPSNNFNDTGWCYDTSQDRLLARTPFADLYWRSFGALNLVATGTRSNVIWGSGTYGAGKKLCFADDGRLQIFGVNDALLWSASATAGTTTTDYVLGVDRCSLGLAPLSGGPALWSAPNRCPHEVAYVNYQATTTLTSTEQIIVHNDRAQLVLQPDGNLMLRTLAGEAIWTTAKPTWYGQSSKLVVQSDGNVVLYGTNILGTTSPRWSTDTSGSNHTLELDGCELSVHAGTTVKWKRGRADCRFDAPLAIPTDTELKMSGDTTLLRTAEAALVWQGDGDLVLRNAGGSRVWHANTPGSQRRLVFQLDGNLVVYGPTMALWASNTVGTNFSLALTDNCTLRVMEVDRPVATLTSGCTVARYSFAKSDGNSTIGTTMRNDLTATTNQNQPATQSDTNVDVTLFNSNLHVFDAHAYQGNVDGADVEAASITIGGDSSFEVGYTYERTIFERSTNFSVGPVPCKLTIGITGELGLAASFDGGALEITPAAGLYATASVGPGGEWGPLSASAGLRGALTLIEVALPISMRVFKDTVTDQFKYTVEGDLTLDSLSGSLAVYAEASIAGFGVSWSHTFFSWTGVSWTKRLFSTTGTF